MDLIVLGWLAVLLLELLALAVMWQLLGPPIPPVTFKEVVLSSWLVTSLGFWLLRMIVLALAH